MKASKIAILVNKSARQGMAENVWNKIYPVIVNYLPADTEIIDYEIPYNIEESIQKLVVNKGVDGFISAGGDGSLNYVLNALISLEKQLDKPLYLGAIGLGSSNDFLKPASVYFQNIPTKINWRENQLADVGKVVFNDANGDLISRYFIINASLGITAQANYNFNNPGVLTRMLKKKWVNGAIIYIALKTILMYRNYNVVLSYGEEEKKIMLSNLSVIKNPNISGNFKYAQNIKSNDNFLGLNYCNNMNKLELLSTLYGLLSGKFAISNKRISVKIKSLKIQCEKFVPIETDGEVFSGKNIFFKVIPKAIYTMGN